MQIAVHFNISCQKQILKRDLKSLVVGKLVELGVIVLPVLPDSPVPAEAKERPTTPFTLPRYDPPSSASSDSSNEARLKVRLARLQMESQEKAESRQNQLKLEIRRMEIEADKAVRLRQLELEAQLRETPAPSAPADSEKLRSTVISPPLSALHLRSGGRTVCGHSCYSAKSMVRPKKQLLFFLWKTA
ncbi:hypothetical protein PAMA_001172 [Pampus argenteus]